MVGPEQQRAATAAAQHLLGRPQRVGAAARTQPQQARGRQAERGQRQGLGRMGRLQQDDAALGAGLQGRAQQAHLADAGLLLQQLDQGADRPTAAGQLGREGGMSGVDAARAGARQLRGAPERRV